MDKTIRYIILSGLPSSGPMYVPVTKSGNTLYSEGFPVRFFRRDGSEWVANFELGFTMLKRVFEFPESDDILVISGGMCFMMNPEYVEPLEVFGCSYETVLVIGESRIILQDFTGLTVVENDATYWHIGEVALDGIRGLRFDGVNVSGLAYLGATGKDEWQQFYVNLDTRAVVYY